jgi:microcystin-dependent protein
MPNNGGWYTWNKTAANNAVADQTVNWQAGMAPSAISPSGRAMMTSVAKGLADISGSLVTSGTSTAFQIESNQQFDTLADFNGQMVCFVPHTTNGAGPVTMTVDGFANLPLLSAPNTELLPGVLIQGTPYCVTFNQADNALYLHGFYGQQSVQIGGMIDFIGSASAFSNWVIPIGQALSRTTYATLFNLIGSTYGAGDGVNTFNIIDVRGRVTAMLDPTGTILTSATMSPNGNTLGAKGGAETETAPLPAHTHGVNDPGHDHTLLLIGNVGAQPFPSAGAAVGSATATTNPSTTGVSIQSAGSGTGVHPNVQPTLLVNKLLRII